MDSENKKMIRAHLTIHGDVQGVFFRAHTQKKAKQLGEDVTGWVANNADGTVTIVAEGPENKIDELINWCHGGPSTAEVEKVEAEKLTCTHEFNDFEIRY